MRHRVTAMAVVVLVATVAGTVGVAGSTAAQSNDALECEFPFTATDATGTEVTVDEAPERIVTLNPSAAQTMWEIGGRDKVVGVSKYATYLEEAGEKANISGGGQTFVNQEKVVDLEPDLVLAPNTIPDPTVDSLREAGLTVYKFPYPTSLSGIQEKTERTGQLTGYCDGAEETVSWMQSSLANVSEAVEGQDRPRVLYVFFGFTAGSGTFVDTVIETAGGDNVAAAANITGFDEISQEIVVDRNPEWIVLNDAGPQVPRTAAYNGTIAVQNNQTVVLQEEYISQPAPRIVRSVVKLAQALHPQAYENATEPTPTDEPTETPDAPGYGIGAAVLVLVLSTLVLGRRVD